MTPTPRTDAESYDCEYRGDMGSRFTADKGKPHPDGDHVSADFARQLERDITELNDRLIDHQPCDWKQDDDGNWDTSCNQCVCFEHAPPFEQGYRFCHHCGATINFITYKHKNDNA
jgi:hypothetical protein